MKNYFKVPVMGPGILELDPFPKPDTILLPKPTMSFFIFTNPSFKLSRVSSKNPFGVSTFALFCTKKKIFLIE